MNVTKMDESRATDIFDDALGDISSFGEWGWPSHREGALRTIEKYLAVHREAAELEGVRIGLEAAKWEIIVLSCCCHSDISQIDPAEVLARANRFKTRPDNLAV